MGKSIIDHECVFYDESKNSCVICDKLETFETMFNAISDAIVIADLHRNIFRINKGLETTFGYAFSDLIGKSTSILYESEEEYLRQGRERFNLSAEEKAKPYIVNYRRKNGQVFPGETIGTAVKNGAGETIEFIGVIRDISERREAEAEIQRLAMTDNLTGLGNRNYFNRRLDESLKLAARQNKKMAFIMLDLDKFKLVNDTYGHLAGDELLRQVATILNGFSREVDVVARVGGDEFMMLAIDIKAVQDIQLMIERIIEKIKKPFRILDNDVTIGVSVGVSIYPDDTTDKETLITIADSALYVVKRAGGNSLKIS